MLRAWQVLVSAAVGVLLAVSAYAGAGVTALAVAALAIGLALGWPTLLGLTHPRGTRVMVLLTGVAGAVAAVVAPADEPLSAVAALAALAVPAAFTHELVRRDGRARLVESVTGTYAGQMVALLGSGWVLLTDLTDGPQVAVVGAAAALAARLAGVLPVPVALRPWSGVALAVAAGAAASAGVTGPSPAQSALVGVVVGAVVAATDRLLAGPRVPAGTAALSAALAPIAAVGTAVYAVARVALGA